MPTPKELLKEGYRYGCIGCNTAYKDVPWEDYPDGHGGRPLAMCRCGCDIIVDFETGKPVYWSSVDREFKSMDTDDEKSEPETVEVKNENNNRRTGHGEAEANLQGDAEEKNSGLDSR